MLDKLAPNDDTLVFSYQFMSSLTYDAIRSSGLMIFPSERTLRDYSHSTSAKSGFTVDIDEQ